MGKVSSRAQNNPYKALTKEDKEALAAKKAAALAAKKAAALAAKKAAAKAAKEESKTKSTFVSNSDPPEGASDMDKLKAAARKEDADKAKVIAKSGVLTGLSKEEKGAN